MNTVKILLTNIEYNEKYKALAVHSQPTELTVEIPTMTMEHDLNMVVCKAVADQYNPALALGIESAEFTFIDATACDPQMPDDCCSDEIKLGMIIDEGHNL